MPMSEPDPTDARELDPSDDFDSACALFAAFLAHPDGTSPLAFEELCTRHARCEVHLREIRASYHELGRQLPGPLTAVGVSDAPAPLDIDLVRRLLSREDRGDRYAVRGELGRGGMGVVLKVWDDELQRNVAMKTMRRHDRDAATWRRFLAEARAIGRLVHPGIVPVLEFGLRGDAQVYYTMPIIDGDELGVVFAQIAAGREGWSLDRGIEILIRVCDAVHFAHDRDVLHRDLKPSNVMVGRYGEVFVMDWGLARVRSGSEATATAEDTGHAEMTSGHRVDAAPSTMAGDVFGTPSYMSPEQAAGDPNLVDQRTDVYAIGAMLYHLLSGVPPFATTAHAPNSDAVLRSLRAGPPPALLDLAPSCSPELAAICERAMARSPTDRYASVAGLAQDLRNHLLGHVVAAFETGALAEFRKWVRRNKALAGAGLLAIVAIAIGFTLGWLQIEQGRAEHGRRAIIRLLTEVREFEKWSSDTPPAERAESPTTRWLTEARGLVRGGAHGSLGLAHYEEALADLERQATGVDPTRIPRLDGEPLDDVLEKKRSELTWLRRMLGSEPWPNEAEVQRQVQSLHLPADALGKNAVAFDLIRPDRPRRFGLECCAVVVAEAAAAAAADDYERFRCFDTLAFALCRVGRWDEALQWQGRALTCVRRHLQAGVARDALPPAAWQRTILENAELIRRLTDTFQLEGSAHRVVVECDIFDGNRRRRSHSLTFADPLISQGHEELLDLVEHLRLLATRVATAESAFDSPQVIAAWQRAAAELASDPRFAGHRLTPQLDLVPLGADPGSHLQEFAHLASGFAPHRDARGRLVITPGSAIVFVLLPPEGAAPPFLLGKFETTNAQWSRLLGSSASAKRDDMATCPVRDLSWRACVERLVRVGAWIRLPSVREWRLGLDAGRDPSWIEAVTVSDLLAGDSLTSAQSGTVDARKPNPYGLYEMLGSAREHTGDRVESRFGFELAHAIVGGLQTEAKGFIRDLSLSVYDCDERLARVEFGLRCARSLVR